MSLQSTVYTEDAEWDRKESGVSKSLTNSVAFNKFCVKDNMLPWQFLCLGYSVVVLICWSVMEETHVLKHDVVQDIRETIKMQLYL
jgi:hypothetical protein